MEYFLPDGQPWFARQLTVRNMSDRSEGSSECRLRHAAAASRTAAGRDHFPAACRSAILPSTSLQKPQWLRPRSDDPLAVLWDATKQRGLGTWYHCEEEFSPVAVRRSGEGAEIRHVQHIVARLKPGQAVTLGKQFFWLAHGSRDEALRGVQQVYRAIELRAPDHGLANLGEMVLYCGHPGGTPEQQFPRLRRVCGAAPLRADVEENGHRPAVAVAHLGTRRRQDSGISTLPSTTSASARCTARRKNSRSCQRLPGKAASG